ncbi:hypothetical protein AAMO2058_000379600 [Amorphochlora amoebiformis]
MDCVGSRMLVNLGSFGHDKPSGLRHIFHSLTTPCEVRRWFCVFILRTATDAWVVATVPAHGSQYLLWLGGRCAVGIEQQYELAIEYTSHNTTRPEKRKAKIEKTKDRELAKVARIRVAMKSSQDISEEMISILQSFEDKLESLEKTILPVHKATRNLMTKQSNLEDTISQVDILIQHQQLAFQAKSLLSISSIEIDLTEFLRLLDRIRLAMSYFHEKSNLKESTARYRELRAALATGLIQCEQEFIKVMAKAPYNTTRAIVPSEEIAKDSESSKAEDKSTMMGSEISGDEENPEDQELAPIIDIQIIARLGAIAACLVRNKKMGFIELFEKERSRQCLEVLMRTCERTFDSNGSYGSLDGKEDILLTSSRPPVIDESAIDLKTKTTRYMSGQHQSLVYIRMLLQVLKLEESVFRETLQRQGGVSSQEYLEAYQKAMEASTDFIIKKVFKAILNESGQNKLLVSLDFLGTLQTLIPQFLEVAPDVDGNGGEGGDKKHFRDRMGSIKRDGDARRKKTPSLREKILQFRLKICELCGLALAEYEQSIRKHGRIKRKKMPQAVHVVTVETINFLFRSLYSYKSTLESRDIERVSEISDARHNFPAITITGSLILWLLDSLELTLKELATKQIQNASLGWVFILNNLQLLDKRMRDASVT